MESVCCYRQSSRGWLDYVRMRMSDIICVKEQAPSGAGTVLINRTHTYNDLLLAMGSPEKKLVDAIDEQQTVGEILDGMLSARDSVMRIGLAGSFLSSSGGMIKWCLK